MSHPINTQYVEGLQEGLEMAIDAHDYALAKDIIHDAADMGFTDEARDLEQQLMQFPLSAFAISLTL